MKISLNWINFFGSEAANIIATIATIVGVLCLIYGFLSWRETKKANKFNEDSAAANNTFLKEKISLLIGTHDLKYYNIQRVYYVIPTLPEKSVLGVPFGYGIINEGKQISDAELYIEFPNELHPNKSIGTKLTFTSRLIEGIKTKESEHEKGYHIHVLGLKIGTMDTQGESGFNDWLLLRKPTTIKTDFPIVKEGITYISTIEAEYSFYIIFQVISNNRVLLNKKIAVEVISTDTFNIETLSKNFVTNVHDNLEDYNVGEKAHVIVFTSKTNNLQYDPSKLSCSISDWDAAIYGTTITENDKLQRLVYTSMGLKSLDEYHEHRKKKENKL